MLDLLLRNAHILTQDPSRPHARSIGVLHGKIVALDEQAERLVSGGAHPGELRSGQPYSGQLRPMQVIDAQGAVVLPGFNDVHVHSVWFGQSLQEIDVSGITSAAELYDTLRANLPDNPTSWVVASGFQQALCADDMPTLAGLDECAHGRPVLIKHNTGHSLTVNSAALRRAGVDPAAPPSVEGGRFNVDSAGYATGLVDENAMRLINEVVLPLSSADIVSSLERATREYARMGITSVTDAGIAGGWIGHSPREFGDFQRAREEGKLHTRVQAMVTIDALHEVAGHADDPAVATLDAGIRTGVGDEWLEIGPTKLFVDGSMSGRTAAMSHDYFGCTHAGYFQDDAEDMRAKALRAVAGGWSLAMHAIGDAAIDFALDIANEAQRRYGAPRMPHRIEHACVLRADHPARLAAAGIAVCPQPRYIHDFGDSIADLLGAERALLTYRGARLVDAGIVVPGSSDCPVVDGTPFKGIQSAVTRRTATGAQFGTDVLSVEQALWAYTVASAQATGWAERKGQIKPGQLADFIVLDRNPLETPAEELGDIAVTHTFIGGRLVYSR